MNKEWDEDRGGRKEWIEWMTKVMKECLRVLKPGAHALVWALPRTSHWTATALEDAGFEIRDIITHHFGSGFPKSLNVGKAILALEGQNCETDQKTLKNIAGDDKKAISDAWEGWGTALKPASEHWILCRKPISEKTVAKNVLRHGTGGINIDDSRISTDEREGRWPANLILSHSDACGNKCAEDCPVRTIDNQSGTTTSCRSKKYHDGYSSDGVATFIEGVSTPDNQYDDSGGASRFFYCVKPSRSEKEEGLDEFEIKHVTCRPNSDNGSIRHKSTSIKEKLHGRIGKNPHPTVKAVKLMEYLIQLITPQKGKVLDPFMGSGSTGIAAVTVGFDFVGIEKDADYFKIAEARIAARQRRLTSEVDFT